MMKTRFWTGDRTELKEAKQFRKDHPEMICARETEVVECDGGCDYSNHIVFFNSVREFVEYRKKWYSWCNELSIDGVWIDNEFGR